VLQAACWKYRMQKLCKKSPSEHHRTTFRAISSQLRHVSTIGKELIKQQYLFRMSLQYGELRPSNGGDRLAGLGHPIIFQRVSRLGFVTAATVLSGSQPNFARCLAVSWAGALYIHFRGLLSSDSILPRAKIHFTSKSCVYARHSTNGR